MPRKLISRAGAAKILEVSSPYLTRLIANGKLKPIDVEDGYAVYDKAAVVKLARQRKAEKNGREGGSSGD